MKKNNQINEIDLYFAAYFIFKNRLILMSAIVIGIILTILYENFKKPFTPIYEITGIIEEISLFEQQKYEELNNHLKFYKSNYLPYFPGFGTEETLDELTTSNKNYKFRVIDQIFNESRQRYYNNLDTIDSEFLMGLFVRIFQEQTSLLDYNVVIVDTEEQKGDSKFKSNSSLKIKLFSKEGNLETWKEILQDEVDKINENVRIFLFNKFNTEISMLERHHVYLIEDLSMVSGFGEELGTLSKKMIDRQISFLNGSPLTYPEKFSSINFKNNSVEIKLFNKSKESLSFEKRIIISIIMFL